MTHWEVWDIHFFDNGKKQDKLASLAKPLKFIALELNSILVLFLLLLGLIFAALTVWTILYACMSWGE